MNSLTTRTVGRFRSAKEQLRSRGALPFRSRGTMWQDPRFPAACTSAGTSADGVALAPGSHAGGHYFNALVSNSIQMSTDMRSGYVRGYGDGQYTA